MSASEKLKVLGEAQRDYGWPGPPVRTMFDALPQIVAVVEAAELYAEVLDDAHLIKTVLSALDETLAETDRSNPA